MDHRYQVEARGTEMGTTTHPPEPSEFTSLVIVDTFTQEEIKDYPFGSRARAIQDCADANEYWRQREPRYEILRTYKTGPVMKPADEQCWRVIDTYTGGRLPGSFGSEEEATEVARTNNERHFSADVQK